MDGDKFRRSAFFAVIAICIFFGPFLYGYYLGRDTVRLPSLSLGLTSGHEQLHLSSAPSRTKDFHFLLPATNPGIHLCKLLLSAQILQYPEPILLGWDGRGVFNGSVSHLFKITETAVYLRSLPPSADDDLVFLIDAYDIWLQLRPSTLLSRYHALLKKHDDQLRNQGILGLGLAETGAEVRSRIVFGADKFPGPPNFDQAFVWAAPNSSYPADVFGNETGSGIDYRLPQYLNSGTIIGPVKELRDFFEATEDAIMREAADEDQKLEHSDQYYFGQVWGPQEVARQRLRDGRNGFQMKVPDGAHVPDTEGMRTEYGVCLDGEQQLFQILSGWEPWLTKLKFDGNEVPKIDGELSTSIVSKSWTMPEDVLNSEGPYAALQSGELPERPRGWGNISLGANAVVRQPYGLLHLTGDKIMREKWWPDLWFHPHGELLQKAARRKQAASEVPEVFLEMDGISYKQSRKMFADHDKAGAWRSSGEYVSWDQLCGVEKEQAELYTPRQWVDGRI